MTALLRDLWRNDDGLILSAEMVVILTITVLGMVVGLANLQTAILGEFADLSLAFQSLNQSYSTPSYRGCWKYWGRTSWVAGSCFVDIFDGCVGGGAYGSDIVSGYQLPSTSGSVITEPLINTDTSAATSTNTTVVPSISGPQSQGVPCPVPSRSNGTLQPVPQGAAVPMLPPGPCHNCP